MKRGAQSELQDITSFEWSLFSHGSKFKQIFALQLMIFFLFMHV